MKLFSLTMMTAVLLGGCATGTVKTIVKEKMMPDGNTWIITVRTSCSEFQRNVEPCKKKLLEITTAHAAKLCGAEAERVFDCATKGRFDISAESTCYAKCK